MIATLDPLRLVHLMFIAVWLGLVLAELVVEGVGFRFAPDSWKAVTRIHYWIDLLFEIPMLAGVLLTGAVLTTRAPVLTTPHWLKIASALVAISGNVYCIALVVLRKRYLVADEKRALGYHRAVIKTGMAIPFGMVALVIGVGWFL